LSKELLTARIPKPLKQKLKREALIRQKTMTDLVIQALQAFLDGNGCFSHGLQAENNVLHIGVHTPTDLASAKHDPQPPESPDPVLDDEDVEPEIPEVPKQLSEWEDLLTSDWASILIKKGRDNHGK